MSIEKSLNLEISIDKLIIRGYKKVANQDERELVMFMEAGLKRILKNNKKIK